MSTPDKKSPLTDTEVQLLMHVCETMGSAKFQNTSKDLSDFKMTPPQRLSSFKNLEAHGLIHLARTNKHNPNSLYNINVTPEGLKFDASKGGAPDNEDGSEEDGSE